METLFTVCAVAGGTLLVIQVGLLLLGFDSGAEGDVGGDFSGDVGGDVPDEITADGYDTDAGEGSSGHDAVSSFKFLTTKTVVAFFTFFGLTGLLCLQAGWSTVWTLATSVASGTVALWIVAYLWALVYRLETAGNVDMRNVLGRTGRVYLSIPGNEEGRGKVTVAVQGRTVELNAVTTGEQAIPTGSPVKVVSVLAADTVRVLPNKNVEEGTHA